jgi:cytochrome c-type biogenesis protein CcmH
MLSATKYLKKALAAFRLMALILIFSSSALALSPEEKLKDETLENRAMELFLEVRCLVCNGQVIENSDSEFSHQMRENIRQKILTGKSNDEIRTDLIEEFGEDILTRPSSRNRFILIALPLIFAASLLFIFLPRRR